MIEHLYTFPVLLCSEEGDWLPGRSQQSLEVTHLKPAKLDVAWVAFLIFHKLQDVELKSLKKVGFQILNARVGLLRIFSTPSFTALIVFLANASSGRSFLVFLWLIVTMSADVEEILVYRFDNQKIVLQVVPSGLVFHCLKRFFNELKLPLNDDLWWSFLFYLFFFFKRTISFSWLD